MIIDHIGISVKDYSASIDFYTKVLAALGIEKIIEVEGWAGYGRNSKPEFWFGSHTNVQLPMHIAFTAEYRSQVDGFYEAAISEGSEDNGKPGIREIYHPNYYGAFVIDINGHNLEAVCHNPE